MRNKKIIALISVLMVCAFAFAACAPAASEEQSTEPALTESPAETPAESPSESPAEQPSEEQPVSEEPGDDPGIVETAEAVTYVTLGEITEVMDDADQIRVTGDSADNPANDVIANITDDTVIIDGQTGAFVDDDALRVGDRVQVTVSAAMTKSMPPMSNAFMVVTNVPEDMMGLPTYIIADEVAVNDDGSATILNQNKDTYVTIPADMVVEAYEPDGDRHASDVGPNELKTGDVVLAWYDVAALSYPAQAQATRAMLIYDI